MSPGNSANDCNKITRVRHILSLIRDANEVRLHNYLQLSLKRDRPVCVPSGVNSGTPAGDCPAVRPVISYPDLLSV